MMKRLSLLLVIVCAACVPANTPNELAALASVRQTQETGAYATQSAALPITRSAQDALYAQSITETFIPPALTATANANLATQNANVLAAQRATSEALYHQSSITATQQALAVLESDTQKRIAENNAAMAQSQSWADSVKIVLYTLAGVIIVLVSSLLAFLVFQVSLYAQHSRITRQTADKWRETFKAEALMLASGVAPTSAGHTPYSVVPLAEKHVAEYSKRVSRDDQVRACLKNYVAACVDLSRQGVRQPFSRANACKHGVVTHPATGDWWQLGHDRIVKMLRAMGVLDNTGAGGETVLVVDVDGFASKIDLTPLPVLPFDPIPAVKLTVAGYQVSQV